MSAYLSGRWRGNGANGRRGGGRGRGDGLNYMCIFFKLFEFSIAFNDIIAITKQADT